MNLNTENAKIRNGFTVGMKMPDINIGDCFLFDYEDDNKQGHIVTDIFQPKGADHIFVQWMPEFTPVCNESYFVYGKVKFRLKKK
jgi:hypothetical protein